MLLSRYSNIEFVLNLDFLDYKKLISKMETKKEEEKAWQMWISVYPDMQNEKFVPFSEFLERSMVRTVKIPESIKSKEQLYSELSDIRKQFESPKEGENVGNI